MHEFAIGEELVKTVLEELGRLSPPCRLRTARVVVGAMRRVIPEHLRFAYEVMTRDTPAAGSSLAITVVPVTALCLDCGWEGQVDEMLFLCKNCGAVNLKTLQGMELFLDQLEVEDDSA